MMVRLKMPSPIGREEKLKLKRAVLKHFANSPKAVPVLGYLFNRAIDGPPGRVSYLDVIGVKGAPESENAVKNLVSRLRDSLEFFFSQAPEGRSQRWKVVFPTRGYQISFVKNDPAPLQTASTAFLDGLWSPYALSKIPIHVLYSESQFCWGSQDKTPFDSDEDGSIIEKRLSGRNAAGGKSDYAFVATGVMQALLRLLEYFGQKIIPTGHGSLRSMREMPEPDQDVIILATSGAAPRTVARLEAALPLALFPQATAQSARMKGKKFEHDDSVCLEKVVLTRRPHRINGRTLTILSAEHAGAIDALAMFLTREDQVKTIAEALQCGSTFPRYFQVVFSIPTLVNDSESFIGPLVLELAVSLESPTQKRAANSRFQPV